MSLSITVLTLWFKASWQSVKPGRNRVGAGRSERGSTMTDRVQQRSEEMMTASEVVGIQ